MLVFAPTALSDGARSCENGSRKKRSRITRATPQCYVRHVNSIPERHVRDAANTPIVAGNTSHCKPAPALGYHTVRASLDLRASLIQSTTNRHANLRPRDGILSASSHIVHIARSSPTRKINVCGDRPSSICNSSLYHLQKKTPNIDRQI